MSEENKNTSSPAEYVAPKIEEVITAENLNREVQYAGNFFSGPR